MNTALLLGAGFAKSAGSPLAAELFDEAPLGGTRGRDMQVNLVLSAWHRWKAAHPSQGSEAFITDVFERSDMALETLALWKAMQTFLALRVSAPFVRWTFPGGRANRSSDNFMNSQVGSAHELWWDTFFHYYGDKRELRVLTTNWDIWVERALRPGPRPRRHRPGFNYGEGPEPLVAAPRFPSAWYRGTDFGKNTKVDGYATLLKIHGSLSWAIRSGRIEKYGDLRPAFRGDAAIVPPVERKQFPKWLEPIWNKAEQALECTDMLIVVGYSFPDYDTEIRLLLNRAFKARELRIHVFDPSASLIIQRVQRFLPAALFFEHRGLPAACGELKGVIST